MPSPEQASASAAFEASPVAVDQRTTSPQMEQVVKKLAAAYGVDLSQQGAQLSLDMPTRPDRWMIANLDGQRISLTRCFVEEDGTLSPDLDMVFVMGPVGLEPIEILHVQGSWNAYAKAAQAEGKPAVDEQGNFSFADFSDYWAQQIEQEGWFDQGRKVDEPHLGLRSPAEDVPFTFRREDDDEEMGQAPGIQDAEDAETPLPALADLRALHKEVFRLWDAGGLSEEEMEAISCSTFDQVQWDEKSEQERQAYAQLLRRGLRTMHWVAAWRQESDDTPASP